MSKYENNKTLNEKIRENGTIILIFTLIFSVILGLSLSLRIMYLNANSFATELYPYPELSSVSPYVIEPVISSSSTLEIEFDNDETNELVLKCPTASYGTNLIINDQFIARTDRSYFDYYTYDILDGVGNLIFIMKFQDQDFFVDGSFITTSISIYDEDNDFIGYFVGSYEFVGGGSLILTDKYGYDIVKMIQSDDIFFPAWTVTLINNTAPLNDFRLSSIIVGYVTFSKNPDNDLCNSYFYYTSYFLIIVGALFGFFCIAVVYNYIKDIKEYFDQKLYGKSPSTSTSNNI